MNQCFQLMKKNKNNNILVLIQEIKCLKIMIYVMKEWVNKENK